MAEVIRMPRMSDTMEEGVIVGWLKKVGDVVEPGDVLAEVETDKATMELESYQDGVLLYIGVKEGPVAVNGILAVIGEEGEDYKAALDEAKSAEPAEKPKEEATTSEEAPPPKEKTAPKVESTPPPPAPVEAAAPPSPNPASDSSKRVKASPLAKSIAQGAGVDIGMVSGSGDNGRIVKKDVEAYLKNKPAAQSNGKTAAEVADGAQSVQAFTLNPDNPSVDFPVSQMRKVIARRLGESKFSAPHFYLTIEIDMGKTMEARKSMNTVSPVKISFNDIVVKAVAGSLKQHPAINSSWLGDKIRQNGDINIGVAVAVEDGLLVPVVKYADMKSLSQINVEVRDLAGKAKNKKLQPDQMTGNTFTISNLGMFGIEEFTAIINPPDACILAVGGIISKPIVKDGELVAGNIMKVTLSCDHRVVDGASGAKFLNTLKGILEDPVRLLI